MFLVQDGLSFLLRRHIWCFSWFNGDRPIQIHTKCPPLCPWHNKGSSEANINIQSIFLQIYDIYLLSDVSFRWYFSSDTKYIIFTNWKGLIEIKKKFQKQTILNRLWLQNVKSVTVICMLFVLPLLQVLAVTVEVVEVVSKVQYSQWSVPSTATASPSQTLKCATEMFHSLHWPLFKGQIYTFVFWFWSLSKIYTSRSTCW